MYGVNSSPYRQERHEEIRFSSPDISTNLKASGLIDGFLVPAARSLFLGFSFGSFAGLVFAALESPFSPLYPAGICWLLVQTGSFIYFVRKAQNLLEKLYGVDFDGDGYIGAPERPTRDEVEIKLYSNNGAAMEKFSFPGSGDQLREFSRGVLSGQGLEKELWSGEGKLYRGIDYKNLRAEMIRRGWVEHKNGEVNQACILTDIGKQALATYAGIPSPTPSNN